MSNNLQTEERDYLEAQRFWLKAHFASDPETRYESVEGKLSVVETILTRNWIDPGETVKLQALGVGLGDALAQALGLEWVTVEDEHGRDPALSWPGTSILCFPMTMISKRIEDGEKVDVQTLFEGVCGQLNEAKALAG